MIIRRATGGTRFPFISLEKALARAEQLHSADRSGRPMQVTTAFELWGYSPKSSGAFQTTAALKAYGLIEDDGANESRTIKLTSRARQYFLEERDNKREELLREFALAPALLRSLWHESEWKLGIPADPIARSHLKIDRGLPDQSARALLSILRENIQFAGLASEVNEQEMDSDFVSDARTEFATSKVSSGSSTTVGGDIVRHAFYGGGEAVTAKKPIMFDMDSVSGTYEFTNADDLEEFISKLEKIKALLPRKTS